MADSLTIKGWASRAISTYDLALEPQYYGELVQKYGDGFYILNFLHMAGQVMNVKNETITILEEGAPERLITVSMGTNAVAGTANALTVASSDGSNNVIRANATILVPAEYTNKTIDQEMLITYNSGWYATPLDATVTIDVALVAVPVIMGATAFGYGTAGADPMTKGYYSRTTSGRIMKDAAGVEGGRVFQGTIQAVTAANGAKGVLSKELTELDFRFDSQIDAALLTAQANTNTSVLTATSTAGGTKAIPSFNGLIPSMEEFAMSLSWDSAFDIDKFASVKTLLESVGVTNKTVSFMVGTDLYTSIEDSMQNYLNVNSPGHSLYDTMGRVGFKVKEVEKNSVTFKIMNLHSFSNPNKFGASSYKYNKMGFMFPEGQYAAVLNGENVKLPHLTLGYCTNNGEDRRRIFAVEPGVNGFGYGSIVANSYDGVKFHVLTHIVPIWNHLTKTIKVDYTGSTGVGA